MLAVSRPQSQTSRSPPATEPKSPWQIGQRVLFEMSMLVKSMSLKSQTSSLPFNVEPIPTKSFTVSMACKDPIIPVVAPRTPRMLHVTESIGKVRHQTFQAASYRRSKHRKIAFDTDGCAENVRNLALRRHD